ncbi:MAG: response regulator [Lentimicrobium sp.]
MPDLLKILLIDDNPDDRMLIIRELKKMFVIDVEEIIDNNDLNRSLQLLDFDIVITDYQLRWTTGIEVLIKIKTINPLLPVIMFTGTGSEEVAVMAMKVGLDDYILKSPQHYVRLALAVKSAIFRMQDEMLRKQAENALRKSEENYRSLVENIGIGFTRFDKDFNILMVNEAQARMFKREPTEFPGLKLSDLYVRQSVEIIHTHDQFQQSSDLPGENLMQGIRSDKSLFDALVRSFPTYNEKGEISGYIETMEDVSRKLRSERLQEVIFNIANAVLVTDSLPQLLQVICNELARVTNTSDMRVLLFSEEIHSGFKLYFASGNSQYREEPLAGKTLARLVLSEGRAFLLNKSEIEALISQGEIEIVAPELKVWMGIPLKNRKDVFGVLVLQSFESEDAFSSSDLEILQFVSNQIAIAIDNKRSADNLRESELRFRSLVEQSADGVIIFGSDGSIIKWNPAMTAISMIPASEVIGRKIYDIQFDISDIANKDENFRLKLKGGFQKMLDSFNSNVPIVDEGNIKLRNGESRIIQLTLFPIRFEGESIFGAFVKDITEQRIAIEETANARKKAEESDRLKTTFLSNISHELRIPLNAIVGFAALLTEQGQSEAERKICSEQIFENSSSLLNQFNHIIEIAKIESGTGMVSFSEFEVNEFMDELAMETEESLVKDNVAFRVVKSFPEIKVLMFSDRHYLKQVLIQLLINAFKFTHEGIVEISYQIKGDNKIIFAVSDTSAQVTEDKAQRINEHFINIAEGSVPAESGLGFGMNVVKKIVTLLGAEVQYHPASPHGKVFSILHPIAKKPRVTEMETFSMDNLATITNKWVGKTILIVEDVDSNYQFLVATIRRSGATIMWARQGEEALEMINNGQFFDLVLMDVQLAGMDGYEVTRKIKELRPGLAVIAQTAYAMTGEKDKSQAAGCDDYLAKPIRPAILLNTMSKYL